MKIYIKEIKRKSVDGEILITVKTYKSMPSQPFTVVWLP